MQTVSLPVLKAGEYADGVWYYDCLLYTSDAADEL